MVCQPIILLNGKTLYQLENNLGGINMKWTAKGHQFDNYGKIFEKRNRLLIYGAGQFGMYSYEQLKFTGCVDGFIDRDLFKQKSGLMSLPVHPPSYLLEQHNETHVIIIGTDKSKAVNISRRLLQAGYIQGVDFWYWEDFCSIDNNNAFFLTLFYLYSQNKIYLASTCIIPGTNCNLNCLKCLNFTPELNKNKTHQTQNIDAVKANIDLYFKWVDYTPWFSIGGGEPLLYPNLKELIEYVGEKYRKLIGERFELVTNGTIIPDDVLCEVFRKYDVRIAISNYEKNVPSCKQSRKSLFKKFKKFNIRHIDNNVQKWYDLDCFNTDNSFMSKCELSEHYDSCANPWNLLYDGKIYACDFAAFAMIAGIINETKNDFFDLSIEITKTMKREFIEFILWFNDNGYVDFCKRCSGWGNTLTQKFTTVAEQAPRD